jgi:hypothetical protein
MIISFMCKILSKESLDADVKREIVHLFVSLCQTCPSAVQYLSLIVDALIGLLENHHQIAMNCFVMLITLYKNTLLVYLPMYHQAA